MNPWLHTIINTWWVISILLLTNSWQLKEHIYIEQNPSTINWGRVTLPHPSHLSVQNTKGDVLHYIIYLSLSENINYWET